MNKTPEQIRALRALHPEMRERDFARIHSISEAELVGTELGRTVTRIVVDVDMLLNGLKAVGEIMALTRNESAVHEKIGPVEKVVYGPMASMVLGDEIDLRIFPKRWTHGFAVAKTNDDGSLRHSFQFFDAQGQAVFKIHQRPATDRAEWDVLAERLRHQDQTSPVQVVPVDIVPVTGEPSSVPDLRDAWSKMTDTHQFFPLLRKLNYPRLAALEVVGDDYAWQLDAEAVKTLFTQVAGTDLPIMVFVGNHGCIQIHSGPIHKVEPRGPWLNVLDPTFHLHLRMDHIMAVWAVRKPTADGHVTSVEVYGADRELIIQFFGQRQEGTDERSNWRSLVENLPMHSTSNAA